MNAPPQANALQTSQSFFQGNQGLNPQAMPFVPTQFNPQQNFFMQQPQAMPQYQFGQSSFGGLNSSFGAPNPQLQFIKTQSQQPDHLFGKGNNSNSNTDMLSFSNLKTQGNQGFLGGSGTGFANSISPSNTQNFSSSFMQPRK